MKEFGSTSFVALFRYFRLSLHHSLSPSARLNKHSSISMTSSLHILIKVPGASLLEMLTITVGYSIAGVASLQCQKKQITTPSVCWPCSFYLSSLSISNLAAEGHQLLSSGSTCRWFLMVSSSSQTKLLNRTSSTVDPTCHQPFITPWACQFGQSLALLTKHPFRSYLLSSQIRLFRNLVLP